MKHLFTYLVLFAMLCVPTIASAWNTEQKGLTYTNTSSSEVSVKLSNFDLTAVTIPATITYNNTTYKVTSIEDHGFTDEPMVGKYGWYTSPFYSYTVTECSDEFEYSFSTYYNGTLKSVTFEQPSNIKTIGAGAFEGCSALETITIPSSVETLGQNVFYCCTGLKNVYFQTKQDGTTSIKTIPNKAFYLCTSLTNIELPEGLTTIEDDALRYNFALRSIKLPNTLTTIGAHFLCDASSLQTLTIPASVTKIDGAFLHGCESLRTVYLLGKASYLIASDGDGRETFGANETFCKEKVTNCTFYVTSDNLSSYESNSVWKKVDGTYDADGKSVPNSDRNDIVAIGATRDFTKGKWVTAIFPHDEELSSFGDGTMAAIMKEAHVDATDKNLYHVTFQLVSKIEKDTPYMFCPGDNVTHVMYEVSEIGDEEFKAKMTQSFVTSVIAPEDNAVVKMTGLYTGQALAYLDFYFSGNKFYRVPDNTSISIGNFRCYWHIDVNNVKSDNAKSFSFTLDDSETTGISDVATSEPGIKVDVAIYDLNGRRINTDKANLPKGLFIINGKKVYVK